MRVGIGWEELSVGISIELGRYLSVRRFWLVLGWDFGLDELR